MRIARAWRFAFFVCVRPPFFSSSRRNQLRGKNLMSALALAIRGQRATSSSSIHCLTLSIAMVTPSNGIICKRQTVGQSLSWLFLQQEASNEIGDTKRKPLIYGHLLTFFSSKSLQCSTFMRFWHFIECFLFKCNYWYKPVPKTSPLRFSDQ